MMSGRDAVDTSGDALPRFLENLAIDILLDSDGSCCKETHQVIDADQIVFSQ